MKKILLLLFIALLTMPARAEEEKKDEGKVTSSTIANFKPRLVGPALTSGRIGDFAVDPTCPSTYYVAVSSGGVWKTTDAGISFSPIFDSQASYSIGCVTVDPSNHNTVWVGSGENNSQRSVSYGDGIYKSMDGGKSWKNMGLKDSKHIGKIIVDPRCSNIVWAAAFGPLWGPGGDRGLYKTTDGGKTWEKSLEISENTGVSDIAIDPRNPDVIYAASYQRRRRVWTLLHGGPENAMYKSTNGGKDWVKLSGGFPQGEIGRIGIGLSPVNPDYIYCQVEAHGNKGGLFRSTNRGASWEKRSNIKSVSAQYYQELVCDPQDVDKLYTLDTYTKVSPDGGKTWNKLSTRHRHVDDHALWVDPVNTKHLIIGGDGGIYESYDGGSKWRHIENLPVTQFYRINCDNTEPFYYVYGGTQDNNSWGGPSRTNTSYGISNEDWFLVVGGDGYEPASDPKNPDIVYGQAQYGWLTRYDRKSGEWSFIQPQPEMDEEHRWNWDTPLLISPHLNTRLYYACNRLYRSDDMGLSWTAVSPDLTRKINRNELKVMDKLWSPEAVAKNASTSLYGNIVSLDESPKQEGLLYVGTDDGLVQISEDGGQNWLKIEKVATVPETTYVSDLLASQSDANVVYAAFNNHKNNDFKPYIFRSNDKGKSWTSIAGDLPDNEPVWTIAEDEVNPDLLFVGTELGLYVTINGGKNWLKIKSGFPTIAVRDLEIQRREHDLVIGTFGRGIYILDDYTPMRTLNEELLKKESHIFPIKDALMYVTNDSKKKDAQGETFFRAKNPQYGAIFRYYIKDEIKTLRAKRQEEFKKAEKEGQAPKYPTFDELRNEDLEEAPYLIFVISDANGQEIRRLKTAYKTGVNEIAWDLGYAPFDPPSAKANINKSSGFNVLPGIYKVHIEKFVDGAISKMTEPKSFEVKLLEGRTLKAADITTIKSFQDEYIDMRKKMQGLSRFAGELRTKIDVLKKAVFLNPDLPASAIEKMRRIELESKDIHRIISGDNSISSRNGNQAPSLQDRMSKIIWGVAWNYYEVPGTAREQLLIINDAIPGLLNRLNKLADVDIKSIEDELDKVNAPYTPGRRVK